MGILKFVSKHVISIFLLLGMAIPMEMRIPSIMD